MRVRERMIVAAEDPVLVRLLPETVSLQLPYVHAETHRSTASALDRLRECPTSLVLADLSMADAGSALLREAARCAPETPVIGLAPVGERTSAEQAVNDGAFDIVWKPIDRVDLLHSVRAALMTYRLRQRLASAEQSVQRLQGLLRAAEDRFREVDQLQRASFEKAKWAATQSCVLSQQALELIKRRLQYREQVLQKHQAELEARVLAARERAASRIHAVSPMRPPSGRTSSGAVPTSFSGPSR